MEGIKLIRPIIIDSLNPNDNYNPFPNIDAKYGPYTDLAMARSVLANYLVKGLTIGIIEEDTIVEYWIEDDTLEFVKKDKNTKIQSDWNETDENSLAYIKNKPNIPTVNDGELTLTVGNKTTKFKPNQSDNATFSVKASDLEAANKNFGVVKTTSTVTDKTGLIACPIIDGVPYFKQTAIADTGLYVNVLRENPGNQFYSNENIKTLNLTKFKKNDIILIPDSFNTNLYCYYSSGNLYSILYPNRLYKIVEHNETDKYGNVVYFAKPFGIEYQKPSVHECKIIPNKDKHEPSYNYHIEIDLAHEVNLVNITERCKLRFLLDNNLLKPGTISDVEGDRILYKKFKIVITNDSEEDKYIYFDSNDENPLNNDPAISIIHKSNVKDSSFTITANSINILYITIVNLDSASNSYGQIIYFVDYYGNTK